jgi:dephospho-CoA kinase
MAGRSRKTRVIAVTGTIGSGKSAVLGFFAHARIPTISADAVARDVVMPGSLGLAALVDVFGADDILSEDGSLDRRRLADLVFADDVGRNKLNQVIHPLIRTRVLALLEEMSSEAVVVVEIPLLDARTVVDYGIDDVLVVHVSREIALQRLVKERGMDPDDAIARMRAQVSDTARNQLARWTVNNDADILDLASQVSNIIEEIKKL